MPPHKPAFEGQRNHSGEAAPCCFRLRPYGALGELQARVHACIVDGARLEEEEEEEEEKKVMMMMMTMMMWRRRRKRRRRTTMTTMRVICDMFY